jgi:hypothetical protein
MQREASVWEAQARSEMFTAEVAELANLPYSIWRDVVAAPMERRLFAADGQRYAVGLEAEHTGSGDDIAVTITLKSTGWRRRVLDQQRFVVTADGRVIR